MIKGEIITDRWELSVWEAPSHERAGAINHDQWMIHEWDEQLRCAVIDGITPTEESPTIHGADSATGAGSIIRSCLRSPLALQPALELANDRIHRPDLAALDRPAASVVTADIRTDGLSLAAAGSCQAWLRYNGEWSSMFAPAVLTGEPEEWEYPPLGRFAYTILSTHEIVAPEAIILATDGAELTDARCGMLQTWMQQLEQEGHADDLAVMRIQTR